MCEMCEGSAPWLPMLLPVLPVLPVLLVLLVLCCCGCGCGCGCGYCWLYCAALPQPPCEEAAVRDAREAVHLGAAARRPSGPKLQKL